MNGIILLSQSSHTITTTTISAALLAVCLLLYHLTAAVVVEITSHAQKLEKFEGDRVELVCEFVGVDFNLFDNPVVWHKMQRLHHRYSDGDAVYNESSQINMMATVLEPFSATKRFKPSFHSNPPTFRFALLITDLSVADVGNYSCRIGGPQNKFVASITHQLLVTADVNYLLISDDDGDDEGGRGRGSGWPTVVRHKSQLVYVANRPDTLRCVVVGGRPAPTVRVRVSRGQSEAARAPTMTRRMSSRTEGERGLRVERRATELVSDGNFIVDVEDDQAAVICEATVDGLAPQIATATITVLYVLVLGCVNATATLGQRNVVVSCELKASPGVEQLHWVIDDNGTTVSETQVVSEYWTLLMDRLDGVLEVQLYVRKVRPESFRQYTLVADNGVDSATASVAMAPTERWSLLHSRRSDYSYQRAVDPSTSTRAAAATPLRTFCFHHSVTVLLFYVVCLVRR